jgi:hypothetical protein
MLCSDGFGEAIISLAMLSTLTASAVAISKIHL